MSTYFPQTSGRCPRCSQELATGTLACGKCHALVHGEELERIAAAAKNLEARGELMQAREQWLMAVPLLPATSKQAEWIRDHVHDLEMNANEALAKKEKNVWVERLGPLAPVVLVLMKGKALLGLFKFKFLFSLSAFMGFYWSLYGLKFGIGFAVLIFIHEMGHYIDIKRRRLPADMPVFLPGFGAYVRWQALGVSQETKAAVSLAGPLAGWMASAVCLAVWMATGDGLWAALARASAWLNVLNLIPVWVLDGGQAANAIDKSGRIAVLSAALVLWLLLGEGVMALVAGGAAFRLFTKDLPAQGSRKTTAYFVLVLTLLGLVMWVVPGHGFGM